LLIILGGDILLGHYPGDQILSTRESADLNATVIEKVVCPLLVHWDLGELKDVVGVISVMLQHDFFTCLWQVENYILHIGKVSGRAVSPYKEADIFIYSFLRSQGALT